MKTKKKTFTFVEVMIATLVMVIIFAGVLSVFVNSANIWSNDMALVELQQKTRRVLHAMSREIRQSKPSAVTISDTSNISFSITDEIAEPPITYTIRYYYDEDNERLVRENPTSGTACSATWSDSKCSILLADLLLFDVDHNGGLDAPVTFCCLGGTVTGGCTDCSDAHSVQVSITTSKTVKGRVFSVPLIKKVKLRNE